MVFISLYYLTDINHIISNKMEEIQIEKKVIVVKSYTVTVTLFEGGTQSMERVNDGFNPLELLGISDFIGQEIKEQIQGKIKPDTITRQVVVD